MDSSSEDDIQIDNVINDILGEKKNGGDSGKMGPNAHENFQIEQNIIDTGFSGESWKQAEVQSSFNNQADSSPS